MPTTIQNAIDLITQLKAQADQLVTDNTNASSAYATVLQLLATMPDPTVSLTDAQTALVANVANITNTVAPVSTEAPVDTTSEPLTPAS